MPLQEMGEISIYDIFVGADFSMAYLMWLPEAVMYRAISVHLYHRPMRWFFISSGNYDR